MKARTSFLNHALEQLGKPVLWARRGPDVFDCSGLVAWALEESGVPKSLQLRPMYNAQRFHDESRPVAEAEALPGDLLFYGQSALLVSHVAVVCTGGMALSADGATPRITDVEVAKKNPHNRVALHPAYRFRRDQTYFAVHRNKWVDDLDKICL
jgi:cell wall-associated NlpC family hydrolase